MGYFLYILKGGNEIFETLVLLDLYTFFQFHFLESFVACDIELIVCVSNKLLPFKIIIKVYYSQAWKLVQEFCFNIRSFLFLKNFLNIKEEYNFSSCMSMKNWIQSFVGTWRGNYWYPFWEAHKEIQIHTKGQRERYQLNFYY